MNSGKIHATGAGDSYLHCANGAGIHCCRTTITIEGWYTKVLEITGINASGNHAFKIAIGYDCGGGLSPGSYFYPSPMHCVQTNIAFLK